jgi:hypothetical protein
MRAGRTGRIADKIFLNVKSDEASATIPRGTPVCLAMDGTDNGLAVVLPGTTAANSNSLVYGVATADLAAGATGEVQAFGYCSYGIVRRGTRAASTDSWTSTASAAAQIMLNIDTLNNCFSTSGGTLAASAYLPFALLAESLASIAASASATSDTRTALTTSAKLFLRML